MASKKGTAISAWWCGLDDEHAVAVGVEAVFFFDGFGVGFHDELAGGEGGDEHHESAAGEVKVGLKGVDGFELVGGVDEDVGFALAGGDLAVADQVFQDAGDGGADGGDFFGRLHFGGGFSVEFVALGVHVVVAWVLGFDGAEGADADVEGEEGVVDF